MLGLKNFILLAVQLARFAMLGIAINAGGYLIYLLATSAGGPPKTTMTFLYALGVAFGYCGNRTLIFSFTGSALDSSLRYFLTHVAGYLLNLSILMVFVDELGYPHAIVQGFAILFVGIISFIVLKLFVFRPNDRQN